MVEYVSESVVAVVSAFASAFATKYVGKKANDKKEGLIDQLKSKGFRLGNSNNVPNDMWSGFREDFKSYNDPWEMELLSPEDYP